MTFDSIGRYNDLLEVGTEVPLRAQFQQIVYTDLPISQIRKRITDLCDRLAEYHNLMKYAIEGKSTYTSWSSAAEIDSAVGVIGPRQFANGDGGQVGAAGVGVGCYQGRSSCSNLISAERRNTGLMTQPDWIHNNNNNNNNRSKTCGGNTAMVRFAAEVCCVR